MDDYKIRLKGEVKSGSVQASLNKIEGELEPINIKANVDLGKAAKELQRASTQFDNFNTRLQKAQIQGTLTNKEFNKLSDATQNIYNDFKEGTITFQEYQNALNDVKNQSSLLEAANRALGQSLTDTITKIAQWLISTTIAMAPIKAFQAMVSNVKTLDASMVELNKVFDASQKELNDVKERAFEVADAVGSTGANVLDATTEFKRMGYTIDESLDLAKIAVMMTNVAEGITDAGDAANILTSILKGTGTSTEYAMSLLDRLNEVSNNNAVGFDNLANMLQESSATMHLLGNNIDETIGLLTGAFSVLQDESVAKGISTIGLRIAGLNEDMEAEAGLANNVSEALEKYAGISVWDDQTGALKTTYQILSEVAEKWDDIGQYAGAQEALLNKLAGKQRAGVAAALIQNWAEVEEAIGDAQASMGSATEENERAIDSIAGAQMRLQNSIQELSDTLLESGILQWLVEAASDIFKVVGHMLNFIKSAPPAVKWIIAISSTIVTLGIAIATATGALAGPVGLIAGIASGVVALASWSAIIHETNEAVDDATNKTYDLEGEQKDLAETYNNSTDEIKKYISELNKESAAQERLLEVERARLALREAQQKKVRVFRAGVGFTYDVDTADVQSAQDALVKALEKLKGNAAGTRSFSGGPTWVGENGPELMNLPQGAEILSNPQSMKLHDIVNNPSRYVTNATTGTGSNSVIINGPINLPNVTDADGFIDAMVAIGNNSIPNFA